MGKGGKGTGVAAGCPTGAHRDSGLFMHSDIWRAGPLTLHGKDREQVLIGLRALTVVDDSDVLAILDTPKEGLQEIAGASHIHAHPYTHAHARIHICEGKGL